MSKGYEKIEVTGTVCEHPLENVYGRLKLVHILLLTDACGYVSVISHEFDDIEQGDRIKAYGRWKEKGSYIELTAERIERV